MYIAELFKLAFFLSGGKKCIHGTALSLEFPAWNGNNSKIVVLQFNLNDFDDLSRALTTLKKNLQLVKEIKFLHM